MELMLSTGFSDAICLEKSLFVLPLASREALGLALINSAGQGNEFVFANVSAVTEIPLGWGYFPFGIKENHTFWNVVMNGQRYRTLGNLFEFSFKVFVADTNGFRYFPAFAGDG
jgi:hypothetical protein